MVMQSHDTAAIKNDAICRKQLDRIPNGNFQAEGYEACNNMVFFRIRGMTRFWENQPNFGVNGLMADALSSTVRHGIPFAFAIRGDEKGIAIYLGTMKLLQDSLISTCQALHPGIEIEKSSGNPLGQCGCRWGGLFTGIPTDKNKREEKGFQIENICRGMSTMVLLKRFSCLSTSIRRFLTATNWWLCSQLPKTEFPGYYLDEEEKILEVMDLNRKIKALENQKTLIKKKFGQCLKKPMEIQ